jgi:sortase A
MAKRKPKIKNEIIIAISIIVLGVLILDGQYFLTQIRYALHKPVPETVKNIQTGEPNRLSIQKLGITAPIIITENKTEKEFQQDLAQGVVHYPGTAKIGEVGNAYIFGHSSDFLWKPGSFKTVFALLPKIQIGDIITASNEQGQVFEYKVIETKIIKPNDLSVLSQDTGGRKILTLQTSYPVGTALKRFIVTAELVE